MAYTFYEPLSMIDAAFLAVEDHKAHMHIGGVTIFDAKPVCRPEGGLDIKRIRAFVGTQLHKVPRFRQKLAFVPIFGRPLWVDDATFNLTYHVRHTALPFPGDTRKLKDLAGRILSQELDRGKPLWELWFVEGLEQDRFAIISKIHHALADGISGVDLVSAIVGPDPDYRPKRAPAWLPRRAPSGPELLSSQLVHTLTAPLQVLPFGRASVRPTLPSVSPRGLRDSAARVFAALSAAIEAPDPTPLNVEIGPYRRFDWTRLEFATAKAIQSRFGGKMNDVVLSIVSGAVRKFLIHRGLKVRGLDFKAMVPMSVRTADERGEMGNRVTQMLTRLPLDEADPVKRLGRVIEITTELKGSGQAEGGQAMTAFVELLSTPIAAMLARMAARHSGNMVVTNVPGPPKPTYLLGAKTLETYPVVPLAPTQALNVAVLSYNEVLHWGFNADWDAVPDLADFVTLVDEEITALHAAAEPEAIRVAATQRQRTRGGAAAPGARRGH